MESFFAEESVLQWHELPSPREDPHIFPRVPLFDTNTKCEGFDPWRSGLVRWLSGQRRVLPSAVT